MHKPAILLLALFLTSLSISVTGQAPQMLKRTITKTDRFDFGAGGTVAITGAPTGSIRVAGSPKNEIEITAEIEVQAPNESGMARLSAVTGFVTEEGTARTGITTVGTNNKPGDKKLWKKFPKELVGLPFRIDYVINVPRYCDLEIDGGKGDLSIIGVQGSMRINFLETNARIEVISGSFTATIASGSVDVALGMNGWAGRPASVQLGQGTLTIRLPSNTSAEIDAVILRTGAIENNFIGLKPRDRKAGFTDKSIIAKVGVGGASLKFTVGDGALKIEPLVRVN